MVSFKPIYQLLCLSDQWLTGRIDQSSLVSAAGDLSDIALNLPAKVIRSIVCDPVPHQNEWCVPILLWVEADNDSLFEKIPLQTWKQAVSADHSAIWRSINQGFNRLLGRRHVCAIVGCKQSSQRFTTEVQQQAFQAGRMAAIAGYSVLTGGLSGVMSKAAEGAGSVNGATIGILPGTEKRDANKFMQEVFPSGIGIARNYQIALACDVMIALNGGRGTMEEMCFALDFDRPVMSLNSWKLDDVEVVESADDILPFLLKHKERLLLELRHDLSAI